MTDEAVISVLELVAQGLLTAAEAGPILDALDQAEAMGGPSGAEPTPAGATAGASTQGDRPGRALRIEVSDAGHPIVNLRVPLALGRAALDRIPGLSESTTDRIREALANGIRGPILDVDDDGDGIRIVIE